MIHSKHMTASKFLPPSAAVVRDRLQRDQVMRLHPGTTCLLPSEQHRQAVQIARCFEHHYLAEVTYLDDCQMTVALVKPIHTRQPAYEIWVDSAGSVRVFHRDTPSAPGRVLSRLVFLTGTALAIFAAALLTSLI